MFCFHFKAIQNEVKSHANVIDKLINSGLEMAGTRPLQADVTKIACEKLKDRFGLLQKASDARRENLQQICDSFQVF